MKGVIINESKSNIYPHNGLTTKKQEDKYLSRILEQKEKDNSPAGDMIEISEESRQAFIRAMKIGYYKAFYKQGLLTAEQLERLIEMNTAKTDNADDNNDPAA